MGGYGVLTAAGASLDPQSVAPKLVPGGLLVPYTSGGPRQEVFRPQSQGRGRHRALGRIGGRLGDHWTDRDHRAAASDRRRS